MLFLEIPMTNSTNLSAQFSFSDLITREEPKGVELAYQNASDEWRAAALRELRNLAQERHLVCADDLVLRLDSLGVTTHSLNAIAGVFRTACSQGWLQVAKCSCGEEHRTKESSRKGNNGRRILVYSQKAGAV